METVPSLTSDKEEKTVTVSYNELTVAAKESKLGIETHHDVF